MDVSISDLEIKNFKSIRHVRMECQRINVLIGKPIVGKSNILEALSLFCVPASIGGKEPLRPWIRMTLAQDLFFEQETKNVVEVNTNAGSCRIYKDLSRASYTLLCHNSEEVFKFSEHRYSDSFPLPFGAWKKIPASQALCDFFMLEFDEEGSGKRYVPDFINEQPATAVRYYKFRTDGRINARLGSSVLTPPYGDNLSSVIVTNKELREDIAEFFDQYKLKLLIRTNGDMLITRDKGVLIELDYSLVADTLRRIIFYLAAIESNQNAVILFEEPEAHSFPPYVKMLADRIGECQHNQFFIATHSPYVLQTLAEYPDTALFVVDNDGDGTTVKKLTEQEIQYIVDNGGDMFFNLNKFTSV